MTRTNEIIAIKPQKLLRREELNSPIVQWAVLPLVLMLLPDSCSMLPEKAWSGLFLRWFNMARQEGSSRWLEAHFPGTSCIQKQGPACVIMGLRWLNSSEAEDGCVCRT